MITRMSRQIDSASLYQLIELFTQKPTADHYYPWLGATAYKTTYALLACDMDVSPAPEGNKGAASGLYEELTLGLASDFHHQPSTEAVQAASTDYTMDWCGTHIPFVQNEYQRLTSDAINFAPWVDWAVNNAWFEHASRLTGLFNHQHIPLISKTLDISEQDLEIIHEQSCLNYFIKQWLSNQSSEAFLLTKSAYICSALIRGIYHDSLAKNIKITRLQHPIRHEISLLHSPPAENDIFSYTNSEELYFLSAIILESALDETTPQARIRKFCANIRKVRDADAKGMAQLYIPREGPIHESVVKDNAVEIVRKCQVDVTPRRARKAIDFFCALGLEPLLGMIFSGWSEAVAPLLGASESTLPENWKPSDVLAKWAYANPKRLRRLADAGVGRIQ